MRILNSFFAYPSKPYELCSTIKETSKKIKKLDIGIRLNLWQHNDISGLPLTVPIFDRITKCDFMIADITILNENVAFEIGFAIGLQKRCLLFRNTSIQGDQELAQKVGIFDTLGYEEYQNSDELVSLLSNRTNFQPIKINSELNNRSPIYLVEPPKHNDYISTLISRLRKARWIYRSFNPSEDIRLSALDAISHVSRSAGVVTPLAGLSAEGKIEHNLRAMFVAGLAYAQEKPLLMMHPHDFPAPLDVRDISHPYKLQSDIWDYVQEFSLEVTKYIQEISIGPQQSETLLTSLSIGDPTAENEISTLGDYYLETDEYRRALRGEVNLVVGRKGSGKTALFIQLRNKVNNSLDNIVIDLMPQGYQLIKLKENVLDCLKAGAQQHLITAFWEYLLLLEVIRGILVSDKKIHLRDYRLLKPYQKLSRLYISADLQREGDFSERLAELSSSVIMEYQRIYGKKQNEKINLAEAQITELLYKHNIPELVSALNSYFMFKKEIWLLFDNIDKGWSVEGVSDVDIYVLRCLIDAARRLGRHLHRFDVDFRPVIFIRDDIYSLLIGGSSDYGKDMRASLDWSNKVLLEEMLRRRITNGVYVDEKKWKNQDIISIWSLVADSHYSGESSLDYIIDRSLMRPRNLLKIFRHCLGYAINLGNERILSGDIKNGLNTYSRDLVIEIDRELVDVLPSSKGIIYEFTDGESILSSTQLLKIFANIGLPVGDYDRVITLLLYYGIIGVGVSHDEATYIHNVNYDMEILKIRVKKMGSKSKFIVHPAVWPALNIH